MKDMSQDEQPPDSPIANVDVAYKARNKASGRRSTIGGRSKSGKRNDDAMPVADPAAAVAASMHKNALSPVPESPPQHCDKENAPPPLPLTPAKQRVSYADAAKSPPRIKQSLMPRTTL